MDYLDPFSWVYWLLGADGEDQAEYADDGELDGGRDDADCGDSSGECDCEDCRAERAAWAGASARERIGGLATLRGAGEGEEANEYFGGDSTTFLGRDED